MEGIHSVSSDNAKTIHNVAKTFVKSNLIFKFRFLLEIRDLRESRWAEWSIVFSVFVKPKL